METWIPSEWYDDILDKIAVATQQSVCSQKPTNFYEAYWPNAIWTKNTQYESSDFIKTEIEHGKQLQVKEKVGILIYKSGPIAYTALLDVANKKMLHITKATSVSGTPLEKGNLTVFYSYNIKHVAEQ